MKRNVCSEENLNDRFFVTLINLVTNYFVSVYILRLIADISASAKKKKR